MDSRRRRMIGMGVVGGSRLLQDITAWQAAVSSIHSGGLESALWIDSSVAAPLTVGTYMTITDATTVTRIRQDGYIYSGKAFIKARQAGDTIKFIVLRLNGTDYDLVGQSEIFSVDATGVQTYTFASPLPCLIGDYFGFVAYDGGASNSSPRISAKLYPGGNIPVKYADVTATNTLTDVPNYLLDIQSLSKRPYIVATGDSIAVGATEYQSFYDGMTGDITHNPLYQLGLLLPGLKHQNHANTGEGWLWVWQTGIVSALAVNPKYVIIHCGSNDIANNVSWADTLARMDAVKVLADAAGAHLIIDEIIPRTPLSDAQAANVRTFNTNYAAWCAANDASLVSMHNTFGKIRVSTGELDDLADVYDGGDGLHLSIAGKQKQAALWKTTLEALV